MTVQLNIELDYLLIGGRGEEQKRWYGENWNVCIVKILNDHLDAFSLIV